MLARLRSLSKWLLKRSRVERELDEELRFHLDRRVDDLVNSGMARAEAERRARLEFGGVEVYKERCREARSLRFLGELRADLRYAARTLRKTPGFTVTAVLSLALGIGANTAIFSLIDAVMLRMLPVKNPEQLVSLRWTSWKWPPGVTTSGYGLPVQGGRSGHGSFSYPIFEQLRTQSQIFSSVFGFAPLGNVNINIDGQASLAVGEMVTGAYFSGLGVSPILGRAIVEEDEKPGAPRVAVISHSYWSGKFGRDPSAVGKVITLNGVPFTIAGVAPPEFFGVEPGRAPDIWTPIGEQPGPWGSRPSAGRSPFTARNWWWMMIMGRLNPSVMEEQARAALDVLFQQEIAAGQNPPPKREDLPHVDLAPASKGLERLRLQFSQPLIILMTIVGVVLLIACANMATLLVARAAARQKEIGVRLAIGASRARLIRQLLTESILLAGMGGACGLLLAYWGSRALVLLMSRGQQPIPLDVHPDSAVLGFTAVVSVLTGILFGLAPALRATRVDVTPALRESPGGERLGLGRLLVITQVALCLLLLVGAGLFVRTLNNLQNQNLGFDRRNLLLFGVNPAQIGYKGPQLLRLYGQLLERLRAVPGVQSATLSGLPLLSGTRSEGPISIQGYTPSSGQSMQVQSNAVGPAFFATMGIPLLLGRGIEWHDTATSPKVAAVNEAMARHFFGDTNPIGRRFNFGEASKPDDEYEIVGLVGNARYAFLRGELPRTAYLAYAQGSPGRTYFEVRTAGDPTAWISTVRRVVHDMDRNLPLFDVKTQTQQIDELLLEERLFARLSSFFSLLALLLACVGLHGTMAYAVTRRTQEIGIRMALGARRADVGWMVMREILVLLLAGIAIGIPAALAAARLISSQLFGLKPTDPPTIAAATILLLVVAAFSGYLPARKASRVDPLVALRYE